MADLIRWFHELEPVERTAAMAVIDDEKFVTFYMNILRDEHHQSKSGASHALFMIDYLEILYDNASRKKPISSKDKFGNFLDYGVEQSAERPSSANDPSLLSFLSSGRVTGSDTSDFDDPYCIPFIAQDNLSRLPNCSIGCRDTEITTSSSAYSPSGDRGTPTDNSECSKACAKNSGLLSILSKHAEALFPQTDGKLENKFLIIDSSHDKKRTVKEEEPPHRTNGCLNDNFALAADLHQAATTSFATSGSGSFDSLFIMRPATEDSHRLVEIFEELSDCRMFSIRPSFQDIMDTFSSSNKSLPMMSWVTEILRPKEIGIGPSPVTYYTILLSRIELSLWHTFYISTGYHTPSPSSAIPPVHGNTDVDDEFNAVVGSFNSVTLLPRTRSSKKSKNSAPVKAVLAPVRNSMVVLERSSLQQLSCAAVMLSLGCIIEEHKASWRVMSKTDMLAIISHFPAASTFYSNPKNNRGRSETVVDRLVLCPLLWITDAVAEQEVKGAYRHLEAVVAGSSRNSNSSNSSWGPQAMDYADLTGMPRLGIKTFDENASRTGAMGFIHPTQSSSGSSFKEALTEGAGEATQSRTTSKASIGLSKRNVVRAVQSPKPVPEVIVPGAPDVEEVKARDKSVEVDTTLPTDVGTYPHDIESNIGNGEHLISTVNEDDFSVPHLGELQELAGDLPTSFPTSKKALKSIKAKTKAAVPLVIKEPVTESALEFVLKTGIDSPAREELWTDPWSISDDACATGEAEERPSAVTSDDISNAPIEPSDQPTQTPVTVTAPPGFEPHHSPHTESDAPTLELDDLSELGTMSRSADEVDGKDLLIDCDQPPIVTPMKHLGRFQHPLQHPSLSADHDSMYCESARNSGRGTPDTSDIINALEGFQGMHEEDHGSAFLSARDSGKERRGSRDSNDSFLSSHRSKRSAKSNRNHNMDVLYASYHSGKDSPPRLHSHHSDGSVTDYKSNRKVSSIGIVTGGPLFTNRRNNTFDRGVSSSSSSSIGSFSPADMNDDRAGCYIGQEEHSPVNKKDHYSMTSEERNRDRHQQRTHVPELWHLRFDPNSPSQSPRGGNPSSFSVPFGPGGSKSPISIGSSSPTGPFVDGRPRSRPSTPREELWGHNNVIHHMNARGMETLGGVQGQGRGQNQNQSGYGHGVVLTPERPGRMNYENRRYDPNQNQHHNQQQQQQQQPHHHHHHQMNGNSSNIINNSINNNNGVYNQNNCYNGKINSNNNNNSNSNNNSNNNSHNNNSNMNNGNINFNDFNYNGSHQFENNNDQRNRQQIARCRSGPYRGMPNNPRADKEMEFKIKAALRLQKLLTKNIRSFNNVRLPSTASAIHLFNLYSYQLRFIQFD